MPQNFQNCYANFGVLFPLNQNARQACALPPLTICRLLYVHTSRSPRRDACWPQRGFLADKHTLVRGSLLFGKQKENVSSTHACMYNPECTTECIRKPATKDHCMSCTNTEHDAHPHAWQHDQHVYSLKTYQKHAVRFFLFTRSSSYHTNSSGRIKVFLTMNGKGFLVYIIFRTTSSSPTYSSSLSSLKT
jgi:hypothetical protein